MITFFIFMIFLLLFYVLNFFISFKMGFMNKNSYFESGFQNIGYIQNSFSINFFVIMIMFVIFDLEIILLLGFMISSINSIIHFLILFFVIFFTFYMEWFFGKLIWVF